jgi:hypothetical protein
MDMVMLGSRLLYTGYTTEQTADLLAAHDEAVRKYTDRADSEERYREIVEAYSFTRIPDCHYVRKIPGAPPCVHCANEVDLGKRPALRPAPPATVSNDADNDPFKEMENLVQKCLYWIELPLPQTTPLVTALPDVHVVTGPPGLGKTGSTLRALEGRRALVMVARHDLAEEAHRLLPDAVVIKPKIYERGGKLITERSLCLKPHDIRAYRSQGRGREEGQVCGKCGKRQGCPYYAQFEQKDKSWIMVHNYAVLPVKSNNPQIVVIDESILSKLVLETRIKLESLTPLLDFLRKQGLDAAWRAVNAVVDLMRFKEPSHGDWIVTCCRQAAGDLQAVCQQVLQPAVQTAWQHYRAKQPKPGRDLLEPIFRALAEQDQYRVSGRVWVYGSVLVLYERPQINLPPVPAIVLDSGADPALLQYLFPGRRLYVHETQAVSPMQLIQVADGNYGVTAFRRTPRAFDSILDKSGESRRTRWPRTPATASASSRSSRCKNKPKQHCRDCPSSSDTSGRKRAPTGSAMPACKRCSSSAHQCLRWMTSP